MIIVKLHGGLGNQLFEYAAAKAISERNKTTLKLDISRYSNDKKRTYALDKFKIPAEFCSTWEMKWLLRKDIIRRKLSRLGLKYRPHWYMEKDLSYNSSVASLPDNLYLDGWWQSERYFKPIEEIIRREFEFKQEATGLNAETIEEMRSVNSVSLHIRRGDYVSEASTNAIHGVCDIAYYLKAINMLSSTEKDLHFFIFSDDMPWVRNNLLIDNFAVKYVDHNAGQDYEDLRLMSSCNHNIIANSSFSWWAAWLNTNPQKKVLAPSRWFQSTFVNNDIIPDTWIKV